MHRNLFYKQKKSKGIPVLTDAYTSKLRGKKPSTFYINAVKIHNKHWPLLTCQNQTASSAEFSIKENEKYSRYLKRVCSSLALKKEKM